VLDSHESDLLTPGARHVVWHFGGSKMSQPPVLSFSLPNVRAKVVPIRPAISRIVFAHELPQRVVNVGQRVCHGPPVAVPSRPNAFFHASRLLLVQTSKGRVVGCGSVPGLLALVVFDAVRC